MDRGRLHGGTISLLGVGRSRTPQMDKREKVPAEGNSTHIVPGQTPESGIIDELGWKMGTGGR